MLSTIIQAGINLLVIVFGKRISIADHPWLDVPMAEGKVIGEDYYVGYAQEKGYALNHDKDNGLVDDFSEMIHPEDPHGAKINPRVAYFYEHTGRFKMDIWAQWYSIFGPFARLLIRIVSPKQKQLNIPLDALATSHGVASQTIRLTADGKGTLTCWQRKMLKTNQVVYAGFYSHCFIPQRNKHCLRASFPLPKGNITVLLVSEVQEDGSVLLTSRGKKLGDGGYYRLSKSKPGFVKVWRLPLHERIHVFEDANQVLRTDHVFYCFWFKLLHLHYKMVEGNG